MPRPLLPWLANSSSQRMSGSFAKHTNATCWTLPLYERTGSGLWPRRGLRCKILLATHAHMPLPKLFSAAMTTVQLEHRKNSHKLDFPDGSRISDVRERAAQSMLRRPIRIMLMEKTKPVLGPASDLNAPEACTGGNHATNTTSSQGATRTAQSAAEKAWNSVTPWLSRSRRSEGENPSCSATDAVDGACADLPPCAHKVERLAQVQDWTQAHETELLGTNEQLERMLLALDGLTGLQGAQRKKKRTRIHEISELCKTLDRIRHK